MKKLLALLGLLLLIGGVLPTRAPPEKIKAIEVTNYQVNCRLDSINNTLDELNKIMKEFADKQKF